jgi:hypothetical protein
VFANSVQRARGIRWTALRVLMVVIVIVLGSLVTHNVIAAANTANTDARKVPQNAAMENALGVRFSRVAVVGDGGLITVNYVVLDAEKATRFQSDVTHPPALVSESRTGGTRRVSLMRQGHNLRAGQTYYLVYQNTRGAIRSGEKLTLTKGSSTIAHVPVL